MPNLIKLSYDSYPHFKENFLDDNLGLVFTSTSIVYKICIHSSIQTLVQN